MFHYHKHNENDKFVQDGNRLSMEVTPTNRSENNNKNNGIRARRRYTQRVVGNRSSGHFHDQWQGKNLRGRGDSFGDDNIHYSDRFNQSQLPPRPNTRPGANLSSRWSSRPNRDDSNGFRRHNNRGSSPHSSRHSDERFVGHCNSHNSFNSAQRNYGQSNYRPYDCMTQIDSERICKETKKRTRSGDGFIIQSSHPQSPNFRGLATPRPAQFLKLGRERYANHTKPVHSSPFFDKKQAKSNFDRNKVIPSANERMLLDAHKINYHREGTPPTFFMDTSPLCNEIKDFLDINKTKRSPKNRKQEPIELESGEELEEEEEGEIVDEGQRKNLPVDPVPSSHNVLAHSAASPNSTAFAVTPVEQNPAQFSNVSISVNNQSKYSILSSNSEVDIEKAKLRSSVKQLPEYISSLASSNQKKCVNTNDKMDKAHLQLYLEKKEQLKEIVVEKVDCNDDDTNEEKEPSEHLVSKTFEIESEKNISNIVSDELHSPLANDADSTSPFGEVFTFSTKDASGIDYEHEKLFSSDEDDSVSDDHKVSHSLNLGSNAMEVKNACLVRDDHSDEKLFVDCTAHTENSQKIKEREKVHVDEIVASNQDGGLNPILVNKTKTVTSVSAKNGDDNCVINNFSGNKLGRLRLRISIPKHLRQLPPARLYPDLGSNKPINTALVSESSAPPYSISCIDCVNVRDPLGKHAQLHDTSAETKTKARTDKEDSEIEGNSFLMNSALHQPSNTEGSSCFSSNNSDDNESSWSSSSLHSDTNEVSSSSDDESCCTLVDTKTSIMGDQYEKSQKEVFSTKEKKKIESMPNSSDSVQPQKTSSLSQQRIIPSLPKKKRFMFTMQEEMSNKLKLNEVERKVNPANSVMEENPSHYCQGMRTCSFTISENHEQNKPERNPFSSSSSSSSDSECNDEQHFDIPSVVSLSNNHNGNFETRADVSRRREPLGIPPKQRDDIKMKNECHVNDVSKQTKANKKGAIYLKHVGQTLGQQKKHSILTKDKRERDNRPRLKPVLKASGVTEGCHSNMTGSIIERISSGRINKKHAGQKPNVLSSSQRSNKIRNKEIHSRKPTKRRDSIRNCFQSPDQFVPRYKLMKNMKPQTESEIVPIYKRRPAFESKVIPPYKLSKSIVSNSKGKRNTQKKPVNQKSKRKKIARAKRKKVDLEEDDSEGSICTDSDSHWVRRSQRMPCKSYLDNPNLKMLLLKLKNNDHDLQVLKLKKFIGPDSPQIVMNAVLDGLMENSNCQALYIQNFNEGMRDQQLLRLLKVLQHRPTIWCLNVGETYNVKRKTWSKFTKGLRKTNITHLYASEHTISGEMKEKMRGIIRANRSKHHLHIDPNNLDVIIQCTHCWWNPINAKKLRPHLREAGKEHLLFDRVGQGLPPGKGIEEDSHTTM